MRDGQGPTPEEADSRRLCRARKTLTVDRVQQGDGTRMTRDQRNSFPPTQSTRRLGRICTMQKTTQKRYVTPVENSHGWKVVLIVAAPGIVPIGGPRSNPVDLPVDQIKSFFTSKKTPQFRLNM